jgi:hypothetical protein
LDEELECGLDAEPQGALLLTLAYHTLRLLRLVWSLEDGTGGANGAKRCKRHQQCEQRRMLQRMAALRCVKREPGGSVAETARLAARRGGSAAQDKDGVSWGRRGRGV